MKEFVNFLLNSDNDNIRNDYFNKCIYKIIKTKNLNEVIKLIENNFKKINNSNFINIIDFFNNIIEKNYDDLLQIKEIISKMLYQNYNCDISKVKHYISLFQLIDNIVLFRFIVNNTNVNNIESVCISLYSLYSSINILEMPEQLVIEFLEKVINCYNKNKDNEALILGIERILMKKIKNNIYHKYYDKIINVKNYQKIL